MTTPRQDKKAREILDGTINTIKGILLDVETNQSIFHVKWFYDKVLMNKNHEDEAIIRKELNNTSDISLRNKLKEKLSKVSQKNCPKPISLGDIIHIKFGLGVGHELKEHHYGIVLSRKGLMFLVAPLTSTSQDYGELNYSFDNLNLSSKTKISHVSFCHIRYIHQRRIEHITNGNNKIRQINIKEHVNNILDNYIKIIKNCK